MSDEPRSTPPMEEREFEDLSLAEAVGDLMRQPIGTARRLIAVSAPDKLMRPIRVRRPAKSREAEEAIVPSERLSVRTDLVRFGLLVAAFVTAMIGNLVVFQPRTMDMGRLGLLIDVPVVNALLWWGISAFMVVVALRFVRTRLFDYEDVDEQELSDATGFRVWSLLLGLPFLAGAFMLNTENAFTAPGVITWIVGMLAIAWAFTPRDVNPFASLAQGAGHVMSFLRTESLTAGVLLIIMLVAASARFSGLDHMPAEMTSDHVEKVLDSQRVLEGSRDIFFANNGGREPFQMYFIALLANLSGGPVTFNHLKVAAAIESLAGVLLLFMLGRTAIGNRDRRLATLLGLALALFAAVGYWHIAITRVSLRIMLTPLVTTIFLIFLMRLMRHNRRQDAIFLGLTIGFGLYAYQALRMLPVVAVAAAFYMAIFMARSRGQRLASIFNLLIIATVSFAVFVPLFRYSTEHPEEFWRRAQGRLLGDEIISETLEDGTVAYRQATLLERASAFAANVPQLGRNMLRALGMFNYRGDVAWLHNAPNYPTFDPVMGAFLMIGALGWGFRAVQKRDHAAFFLLGVILLMLVPSVVAIANPDENPSNTRASGAMPIAYLFAAFGAVGVVTAAGELIPKRAASAVAVVVVGGSAIVSLSWTNMVVFGPYDDFYQNSWSPQREAGEFMRGVAQSDGAWGNVFILAAAHFFDFRGVALEAGVTPGEFPNGDIQPHSLPRMMLNGLLTQGQFRLDPDRYIVIMYHANDDGTAAMLQQWFPEGRDMIIDTRRDKPWLTNEAYRSFRIPPLGLDGLRAFFESQDLEMPTQ